MKIVLALVLVVSAVFKVTEGVAGCYTAAAAPTYSAGVAAACTVDVTNDKCFDTVSVTIATGVKSYEKGCVVCVPTTGDTIGIVGTTEWKKHICCEPTDPGCNDAADGSITNLGPTCMECADSTDEKCVKGGETAADPYKEGTDICNVLTSWCYVEMKADGTVTRGCKAACADAGKPGDATFTKCCITKDHCNQDDATKTSTDGGDGDGGGDGDKDGGAQAVFASYALLFSCLLLAYLK